MKIEWSPDGFPPMYVASFRTPDELVVSRTVQYLDTSPPKPAAVIIRCEDDGFSVAVERLGASLRVPSGENRIHLATYTTVNWDEPGRVPGDYAEYARTFWSFTGPTERQVTRAQLLAQRLEVPLGVWDKTSRVPFPERQTNRPTLFSRDARTQLSGYLSRLLG